MDASQPSSSRDDLLGQEHELTAEEKANVERAETRLAAAVSSADVEETEERRASLRQKERGAQGTLTPEQRRLVQAMAEGHDPTEVEVRRGKLREAFGVFDADGGGSIDFNELSSILNLVGLEDKVDCDFASVARSLGAADDGVIEMDEFMAALEPYVYGVKAETEEARPLNQLYDMVQADEVAKLKLAFQACDADGSGDIDKGELGAVMASMGENLSEKELTKMFDELDVDGGGEVSYSEFIHFMCRRNAGAVRGKAKSKFFNVDALAQVSSFMKDKNISDEESKANIADMPALERLGANYMKDYYRKKELKSKKRLEAGQDADVHILSKEDRGVMQRIERWALLVDVTLGLISALVAGFAELFATDWWDTDGQTDGDETNDPDGPSFGLRVFYFWLVVGGVSVGITVVEIALIYYVHLKAAVKISRVTGLKLFPVDKERAFVTAALARAALELPHPNDEEYGVNPLAEASRVKLAVAALAYKAKTGVSTFVVRLLLKRVLVRVALKSLLFFAAAPVQMLWNFLVGYTVLRATRVVALGPSAAIELSNSIMAGQELDETDKAGLVRAIATVAVAKEALHPNLRILLKHVVSQIGWTERMVGDIPVEPTDGMPATGEQLERQRTQAQANRQESSLEDALPPERMLTIAVQSVDDAVPGEERAVEDATADRELAEEAVDDAAAEAEAAAGSVAVEMVELADEKDATADDDDGGGAGGGLEAPADGGSPRRPHNRRPSTVEELLAEAEDCFVPRPGNARIFRDLLEGLNPPEARSDAGARRQQLMLKMMALAIVLDGFVSGKVGRTFATLCDACFVSGEIFTLKFLTFRFIRGQLSSKDIDLIFDPVENVRNNSASRSKRCMFCLDRTAVACSC